MLKNNQYLNNEISWALQEETIEFFFVDTNDTKFLHSVDEQLVMSKNTRDRLLKENIINDDSETASNTLIVDNLNDGFVYVGKIYDGLGTSMFGDIYVEYPEGIYLMYIK